MDRIEEILAALADPSALSDADLTALEAELRDLYAEVRGSDTLDEATIDTMRRIAEAIANLQAASTERAAAAEERERLAAELDAAVLGKAEDETDAPEAEVEAEVEEEAPVAIAASAPRVPLARVQARTPQVTVREPERPAMLAAGNVGGFTAGQRLDSDQVARAMASQWHATKGQKGRFGVVSVTNEYPSDRHLGKLNPDEVTRVLREGTSPAALTAAGGVCAPTEPHFDYITLPTVTRPVRDSLARFGADRGGVRFVAPSSLSAIGTTGGSPNQAVGVITEAQDTGGTDKTYQTIVCGEETEVLVDAVYNQLQFGVQMERFHPERVRHFTELALAAHARTAENKILTAIENASITKNVFTEQDFGLARDVLNYVNLAAANFRNRHRMNAEATLDLIIPAWVVNAMQNDAYSGAYPAGGEPNWTLETVRAAFARRNVSVTFTDDGVGSGQIAAAQADGADLNKWSDIIKWYLFPPGTFAFLDGGTLDLGVVRDADLVNDNSFRTFVETFEGVVPFGVEALAVTSTICANGGSAGTIAPDNICDGGS